MVEKSEPKDIDVEELRQRIERLSDAPIGTNDFQVKIPIKSDTGAVPTRYKIVVVDSDTIVHEAWKDTLAEARSLAVRIVTSFLWYEDEDGKDVFLPAHKIEKVWIEEIE